MDKLVPEAAQSQRSLVLHYLQSPLSLSLSQTSPCSDYVLVSPGRQHQPTAINTINIIFIITESNCCSDVYERKILKIVALLIKMCILLGLVSIVTTG